MSLNSVNTNQNAYIALQSLNETSTALSAAQKQISTGYRVSDAFDDGAAFAVAQKVRSDISGLTAVNQQLGNAAGLVDVAQTALTTVSNAFSTAKGLLVDIANASTSSDQRAQYVTQYQALVSSVATAVDGSSYNGQTLLGASEGPAASTTPTPGSSFTVVVNEDGSQTTIAAQDQSSVANTLASLIGETFTRSVSATTGAATDTFGGTGSEQASASTSLVSGGLFDTSQANVATSLNNIGSDNTLLNATITFNNDKIDSLNSGLGALIDADLTKESAILQSLQVKQQLGTQALSIANQSPQTLLSLFK
jgi:flagellin